MAKHFLGYLRTAGGQLKMFQILVSLVFLLFLMLVSYESYTGMYVFRFDTIFMMGILFTNIVGSGFIMLSVLMGSTRVPLSLAYRLFYATLAFFYVPSCLIFVKEEGAHAPWKELVISCIASVVVSFGLIANTVLAFQPSTNNLRKNQHVKHYHHHHHHHNSETTDVPFATEPQNQTSFLAFQQTDDDGVSMINGYQVPVSVDPRSLLEHSADKRVERQLSAIHQYSFREPSNADVSILSPSSIRKQEEVEPMEKSSDTVRQFFRSYR